MAVSQEEYDKGTAAALEWLKEEIQRHVPGMFRGMIPIEKEPDFAAAVAKVVLDAADKA